jgi:sugar phosphate isomerase/epimerase
LKLGCCLNLLAKTETRIGDENAALIRELGYDYIELPLAQVMDLSEEDFSKMRARIGSLGIPVEACNNFFPASVRLTGENADLNAALDYVKRATARAAAMGAKVIVLGSSGAKNIPEGFPYARAREQLIRLIRGIQPIVAPLGITVALEPINTTESNFILSAGEALAVVEEAGCDNVRLLVDYYHMRMENEGLDVLDLAGKHIRHTHIAAKAGRAFPRHGDGEDYAAFFAALKAAGYDARVSVEAYSKDIPEDGKAAANALRPLMN